MKIILQGVMPLVFVAVVSFYWWQRETVPTNSAASADAVRLTLSGATVYQFAPDGKQKTTLRAATIEKLKNGDTNFYHPVLQDKITGKIWQVQADFAKAKKDNGFIWLKNQVLATETLTKAMDKKPHFVLQTTDLVYDRERGRVQTDAPIFLATPEGSLEAVGLVWQIADKIFILKKQIRSHYVSTS